MAGGGSRKASPRSFVMTCDKLRRVWFRHGSLGQWCMLCLFGLFVFACRVIWPGSGNLESEWYEHLVFPWHCMRFGHTMIHVLPTQSPIFSAHFPSYETYLPFFYVLNQNWRETDSTHTHTHKHTHTHIHTHTHTRTHTHTFCMALIDSFSMSHDQP